MRKETWKKIEYIVAAVLTLAVLSVCVYQLRFGIDVQDTASYITKFRYLLLLIAKYTAPVYARFS